MLLIMFSSQDQMKSKKISCEWRDTMKQVAKAFIVELDPKSKIGSIQRAIKSITSNEKYLPYLDFEGLAEVRDVFVEYKQMIKDYEEEILCGDCFNSIEEWVGKIALYQKWVQSKRKEILLLLKEVEYSLDCKEAYEKLGECPDKCDYKRGWIFSSCKNRPVSEKTKISILQG